MGKTSSKMQARLRRHERVRARVSGTSNRPRLNVYRSLNHIYAQLIDDSVGHTLVAASTMDLAIREQSEGLDKTAQARLVGKMVGERALNSGIEHVVFDRGGYLYHGRVKALAEGAREAGLDF